MQMSLDKVVLLCGSSNFCHSVPMIQAARLTSTSVKSTFGFQFIPLSYITRRIKRDRWRGERERKVEGTIDREEEKFLTHPKRFPNQI